MLGRDDYDWDDDYGWWHTSREAYIVKWAIFLALLVAITTFFIVGRQLARRRIRAGRKPVTGTTWLLSRSERAAFDPRYAQRWPTYAHYGPNGRPGYGPPPGGDYYGMNNMPPPPPVYDANRPPQYDGVGAPAPGAMAYPPEGASKVDPGQGGGYAPPPGPPPNAASRP